MQVAKKKLLNLFVFPVLINKSGSGIFFVCKYFVKFFSFILSLFFLIFLKALINSDLEP